MKERSDNKRVYKYICVIALLALLAACRKEDDLFIPEEVPLAPPAGAPVIKGFYLLNEGNMGSNKSTLDYYDYQTGVYSRNIFAAANPTVPKEMGDVGNDLKIYGGKLYAVINCSNKIDVMDKRTAEKVGQIDIPNCRYIRFHEGYAYVTSYAGPVEINPAYEQTGYVAKVDTGTYEVVARCLVGFQPDELEIAGGRIYVANSGGYMAPNYENTVSVIDLETFTETGRIEVAVNLHHLRADRHGNLWVSSRGDYYGVPSRLYWIDLATSQPGGSIEVAVSNFHLDGDSLYLYSVEWSYVTMSNEVTYGIVDVEKKALVTRNFITDGTGKEIKIPYGLTVDPLTKDIYVTDARNYVLPGTLYCFDKNGRQKWNVRTGDIPAHFAFREETSIEKQTE
ncbi:MAG: YncE family protein [Tannerellaceae bacterium]|jgi:DNA-binding beta-propeller fold protein YncE|nr:YncE family protein [Tannerellaceae bacterium]